jgi:fructose-1,6-bisphosphatase II
MSINYGMEIVRATEISALIASRMQGLGNHLDILTKSREALTKILNRISIDGTIVNDRFDSTPISSSLPRKVGTSGPKMEIMAIALDAHHSASNGNNNATSYAVIANEGSFLPVPNLRMYKIVAGPAVGNVIDIQQSPVINVKRVARALKKYTENVTVCILNHSRNIHIIEEVRSTGARIKLIEEGEISGCLAAIQGEKADVYMGYGYAPESVMVAAAISCLGGYFEGKIVYETVKDKDLAISFGIVDSEKIFRLDDLILSKKELAFAGTGVTDGEFLEGVRFTPNGAITNSFIARAETHTYRRLETTHFFDYKPVF